MKKRRSKLNIILGIALILAVATVVIGSAAYLSYKPAPKTNHLTLVGPDNIVAQIEEDFDSTDALVATPGDSINKQVWVTNTSTAPSPGMDEWIAVELTFTNGGGVPDPDSPPVMLTPGAGGTMADLLNVANTNYVYTDTTAEPPTTEDWLFNSNDWIRDMNVNGGAVAAAADPSAGITEMNYPLQPTEIFYYKWKVPQGGQTTNLIDSVNFLGSATLGDIKTLEDDMNGFVINVSGAVVQGDMEGQGDAAAPYGDTGPLISQPVMDALLGLINGTATP